MINKFAYKQTSSPINSLSDSVIEDLMGIFEDKCSENAEKCRQSLLDEFQELPLATVNKKTTGL